MSRIESAVWRLTSISALLAAALLVQVGTPVAAFGQATVSNTSQRPFVIATIPVIGRNGAVGGVSINPEGVLARAARDDAGALARERRRALKALGGDIEQASPLRKVSLRGLEALIASHRQSGQPLPDEALHLAGLQRVTHLFVAPESGDIIVAGPAEGWTVNDAGDVVGVNSGLPTVELADLAAALRTAEAASKHVISCSIDPTDEGVTRLQRVLKSRNLQMNASTVALMEKSLGPQQITITGVSPDSHFARVMVAADFLMKRLAMGFEPAPIDGLPSFMEMVRDSRSRPPRSIMPRWWLATDYEPMLRDAEGLAWRLQGQGVRTMTELALAAETGQKGGSRSHRLAEKWADDFTARYAELSKELPVFGKLRNCIDLSVMAALVIREDLPARVGLQMPLLTDPRQVQFTAFHNPKTVDSRATFFKKNGDWVISVSGGVDIDSWGVLEKTQVEPQLVDARAAALNHTGAHWWWD